MSKQTNNILFPTNGLKIINRGDGYVELIFNRKEFLVLEYYAVINESPLAGIIRTFLSVESTKGDKAVFGHTYECNMNSIQDWLFKKYENHETLPQKILSNYQNNKSLIIPPNVNLAIVEALAHKQKFFMGTPIITKKHFHGQFSNDQTISPKFFQNAEILFDSITAESFAIFEKEWARHFPEEDHIILKVGNQPSECSLFFSFLANESKKVFPIIPKFFNKKLLLGEQILTIEENNAEHCSITLHYYNTREFAFAIQTQDKPSPVDQFIGQTLLDLYTTKVRHRRVRIQGVVYKVLVSLATKKLIKLGMTEASLKSAISPKYGDIVEIYQESHDPITTRVLD